MPQLQNRSREIGAIDALLHRARVHGGGALVLRGDAGVGLTALLNYAVAAASDMLVLRVAGVEAEANLAYGALHRLLAPEVWWRHRLRLPLPQRLELERAFGLETPLASGEEPGERNALLVGLGALTLLARAAYDRPVLCAIDDAEQLDEPSARALALAARRLGGESIAMLFTRREPSDAREFFSDLDELLVSGLADTEARALIDDVFGHRLDASMREWILTETGGNPRAILELPSVLPMPETSVFAEPLPLAKRMEQHVLHGYTALSPGARDVILLAAMLYDGSAALFWRGAELLRLGADAYREAEEAGLLMIGTRVALRGSLLRSAVYGAAAPDDRRRIHRALGDAADAAGDSIQAAWHRAAASPGPDEDLASALVAATRGARGRGDTTTVATLLERASAFTPAPAVRGVRLLDAAKGWLDAGSPGRAAALLAETTSMSLTELDRARAAKLRAQVAQPLNEGSGKAGVLLRAAQDIAVLDEELGRESLLEALEAAIYFGRFGSGGSVRQAAHAALEFAAEETNAPPDLLLRGLALLFTSGHAAAVPTLRLAIKGLRAGNDPRWLTLGGLAALEIWDDAGLELLVAAGAELTGAPRYSPLSVSLALLAGLDDTAAGRFGKAAERFAELRILSDAVLDPTIADVADAGSLMVWAWRDDGVEDARESIERCARDAMAGGHGRSYSLTRYALAVRENGLGRYEEALIAAQGTVDDKGLYLATFALPELVEAAVRCGERDIATRALAELAARTLPSGTNWAMGMLARSCALLAAGEEAEAFYREAIERLVECRAVPQLARAHLLYGEWLRRHRRRRDAREHLRRAEGMFVAMSAEGFAARARGELLATGEHTLSRESRRTETLTAQEARIASLVAAGSSNPATAAQLFLSPRTVEYHLHKIYRKLGVSSRVELARTLIENERPVEEVRDP
jgi:DNA-binding CsgD family transcriptional regulator/tetratricopeptide (TPR) repeat protein